MELIAYIAGERTPFVSWYEDLDDHAAVRVTQALDKMRRGIMSGLKSVGGGVYEYRVDFGPGYRIYIGLDGNSVIILLGGGSKQRQRQDIAAAKRLWEWRKQSKRRES